MASLLSNYLGNAVLQTYLINNPSWLALHETDPGVLGDLSTEFTGGGYARQPTSWSAPGSKTTATTNAQIFSNLLAADCAWIAIWDAVVLGHILLRVVLPSPVTVAASGNFVSAIGDVAFTL